MEDNNVLEEGIGQNSAEIIKLIENKCLKPLEIHPTNYKPNGKDANWYLFQGYQNRLKGDFDAAIIMYRQGLRLDNSNVALRVNLGVCLMRLGLLNAALEIFSSLNNMQSLINSSICHISTQNYTKAIPLIEKALTISQHPSIYQLLSLALFRAGRVTEALEVFKDVDPSESLMQDERNLRFNKDPNALFPYKVGEISVFDDKKRPGSHSSTRYSGRSSLESTFHKTLTLKKRKKCKSDQKKKNIEVEYPNKVKLLLPSYEEIMDKKRQFDNIVRKRHNTLIEAISSSFPAWKYDGFVQQKIESGTLAEFDLFEDKQAEGRIERAKRKLDESCKDVNVKIVIDHSKMITMRLTDHTLKAVCEEFVLETEERDYEKLETILKNLPFFFKFPSDIRHKLIRAAVFRYYEADEIIIKQGEIGDSMFVILSGSILIMKKSADFGNKELIINSMYDGETFGELALLSEGMSDNIKRSATCIAGERTTVLAISKQSYKRILLDEMQNDITGKVHFFLSLPLFEGCIGISLIPLASNIEPKTYKIDQTIIELGEKPKGLYIIYSGRCSLYWEGFVAKPLNPSAVSNIKIRPKTPRHFSTPSNPSQNQSINIDIKKARPYLPTNFDQMKVYKDKILNRPLKEGEFFGGRSLIEGLLDTDRQSEHQVSGFEVISANPAKFTVVAESAEVKVFILTRKHFPLLSEEILNKLRVYLTKNYELDCPKQWSDEFLRSCFVEWSKYKQKFIHQVELENYMRRHKFDAPRGKLT